MRLQNSIKVSRPLGRRPYSKGVRSDSLLPAPLTPQALAVSTQAQLRKANAVAAMDDILKRFFAQLHLPFAYQKNDAYQLLKKRQATIAAAVLNIFVREHAEAANHVIRAPAEKILLHIFSVLWALRDDHNTTRLLNVLEITGQDSDKFLPALRHVLSEILAGLHGKLCQHHDIPRTTGYSFATSWLQRRRHAHKTAAEMMHEALAIMKVHSNDHQMVKHLDKGTKPPTPPSAIFLLEWAAAKGDIEAATLLGTLFATAQNPRHRNAFSDPGDIARGLSLLKIAAEGGQDEAYVTWVKVRYDHRQVTESDASTMITRLRELTLKRVFGAQEQLVRFLAGFAPHDPEAILERKFWDWSGRHDHHWIHEPKHTPLADLERILAIHRQHFGTQQTDFSRAIASLIAYRQAERDFGQHPNFSKRDEFAFFFDARYEAREFEWPVETFGASAKREIAFPLFTESDLDIIVEALGEPKPLNPEEFLARAHKKEPPYMVLAARLLENGQGVPRNYQEARHWYELSLRTTQDPRAAEGLQRLFFYGDTRLDRDFDESLKWFCFLKSPSVAAEIYRKFAINHLQNPQAMEFAKRKASQLAGEWQVTID